MYIWVYRIEWKNFGRSIANVMERSFSKAIFGWNEVALPNLPTMEKKDTNFNKAIRLEKRVAIGLYCMGSSAEYRSVGNIFGVGKSTVCLIVLQFCKETWNVLHPRYLNHFPLSRETIIDCMAGFNRIGFPQCIGAIGKLLTYASFILFISLIFLRWLSHKNTSKTWRSHWLPQL